MSTVNDPSGLRFSLRMMFAVIFAVAVICALLFTLPGFVAVPALIFMHVAVPALLTAGVVYSRGMMRAFCIGGLFPAGLGLYTTGWMLGLTLYDGLGPDLGDYLEFVDDVEIQMRLYSAALWMMILIVGRLTVGVYNLVMRSSE